MKQIPLTPDLVAKIQAVAGVDVSTDGLAVFEAIALNTLPLPGKRGSLFANAVNTPLTLRDMAAYINEHGLPLAEDHMMDGSPIGKVFFGELLMDTAGPDILGELRILFYLDPTETVRIIKLNAGVIDEVSVGFLGAALLCSDCGWDYLGEDSDFLDNVMMMTCANGHVIGTDGTHLNVSGLGQFYETSLVQRGAASKPKIVGKSVARLPSGYSLSLAARGFEVDRLSLTASKGEKTVDFDNLVTKLTEGSAKNATLTIELATVTAALATISAEVTALKAAAVADATKLADAVTGAAADVVAELNEARTVLTEHFTAMFTATGETLPTVLPTKVAELKAGIDARTLKLTSLIPVGGLSQGSAPLEVAVERDMSAFKLAK